MKKTLVAQCAAALISGFALVGGANAAVVGPAGGPAVGLWSPADQLIVNTDGLGHILFVPYYSVQNDNTTLINIVNTDMLNAKAVKVRFRGASNSDDVYDITVLMSPGDVWAAGIAKDATTGKAKLITSDKSCTLPFALTGDNAQFRTERLDQKLTGDALAAQTREGYVEILTMADIPPATAPSLYADIKHTAGVPAGCQSTRVTALFTDSTDYANAQAKGLEVPTTGLMANWTIINVPLASAYAGAATAVEARVSALGVPGYGNIVLSPQAATAVPIANAREWTSDPLLRGGMADNTLGNGTPGTAALSASAFDFPDMSTPYLNGDLVDLAAAVGIATKRQASRLTAALAVSSVTNEYATDPAILAKTDWIFSMPTRRYNVARDYASGTSGANTYTNLDLDDADADIAEGVNWFTPSNITTTGGVICVTGISTAAGLTSPEPNNLNKAVTADREEKFVGSSTEFVVSPGQPAAPLTFCGEVSVLSFNTPVTQASVLGAALTRKDLTLTGFVDGWVRIATPGLGGGAGVGFGLPIVGAALMQYSNGPISSNYGVNFPHRSTRY